MKDHITRNTTSSKKIKGRLWIVFQTFWNATLSTVLEDPNAITEVINNNLFKQFQTLLEGNICSSRTKSCRLDRISKQSTEHLANLGISSPERRISHFHPNRNKESYAAVFRESFPQRCNNLRRTYPLLKLLTDYKDMLYGFKRVLCNFWHPKKEQFLFFFINSD